MTYARKMASANKITLRAILIGRYIPSWFTVSNTEILEGYFHGESTFHTVRHIKAWFIPISMWSSFIFFLYFSLLCIS